MCSRMTKKSGKDEYERLLREVEKFDKLWSVFRDGVEEMIAESKAKCVKSIGMFN